MDVKASWESINLNAEDRIKIIFEHALVANVESHFI